MKFFEEIFAIIEEIFLSPHEIYDFKFFSELRSYRLSHTHYNLISRLLISGNHEILESETLKRFLDNTFRIKRLTINNTNYDRIENAFDNVKTDECKYLFLKIF